jgi:hypothetical protein
MHSLFGKIAEDRHSGTDSRPRSLRFAIKVQRLPSTSSRLRKNSHLSRQRLLNTQTIGPDNSASRP